MHHHVLLTHVLNTDKNKKQHGVLLLVQARLHHIKPTASSLQDLHWYHSSEPVPLQDVNTTAG